MGQPPGGFPKRADQRILRATSREGAVRAPSLPAVDFKETAAEMVRFLHREPDHAEVLSYVLYPRSSRSSPCINGTTPTRAGSATPVFLCGPAPGEEISIDIEEGKTLIVKFLTVGDPHADGSRSVFFELNGQPRDVSVIDRSLEPEAKPGLRPIRPILVAVVAAGGVAAVAAEAAARRRRRAWNSSSASVKRRRRRRCRVAAMKWKGRLAARLQCSTDRGGDGHGSGHGRRRGGEAAWRCRHASGLGHAPFVDGRA